MPMKRDIVVSLFEMIETYHKDTFWKVFLQCVSPETYPNSGASEYELLFNYTLQYKPKDYAIVNLTWRNTHVVNDTYNGTYEACHWYMRS